MHPLAIHCNADLPEAAATLLREGVVPHQLGAPLGEADVSFGQPDVATVIASPRLRWVQLTSAGYTSYDRDDVRAALGEADHVIDVLPAAPGTERFFDAARFAALKPGAMFYNVGRGTTVDQEALLGALASGRVAAAYLDVTTPEPLPPDHPLWTAP